ncbi:DUF4212 domain-containing protein [Sphaerotilus hippei]|nr:DUF4212 domain-containing protein [Sphaerotilus hippei]
MSGTPGAASGPPDAPAALVSPQAGRVVALRPARYQQLRELSGGLDMAKEPARPLRTHPEVEQARAIRVRFWRRTRLLTLALLAVWLVVTLTVSYFARELSPIVAGWPLSFWGAAQGALIVYVLIIVAYSWVMDRLEQSCQDELRLSRRQD